MKRRAKQPATEQHMTDGTKHLGTIIPRAGGFEVFDAEGNYRFKCDTMGDARVALINLHRELSA